MARKFSLQVKQNLKSSVSKPELTDDVSALLAVVTWILPATFFGLNGYAGLATSFGATWGLGALFNIPAMRRAAWALGGVQLAYTLATPTIESFVGKPIWRMDSGNSAPVVAIAPGQTPGTQGLANAIQAGARMTTLPNGTQAPSYDGMMDRFSSGYTERGLEGYSADYGSPAATSNAPRFKSSPFA